MEFRDPEAMSKELAAKKESASPTTAGDVKKMCLEVYDGYFTLTYEGDIPPGTSWDWIGLYTSVNAPDDQYIGGNNWNWACRGRTYRTATPANTTGYEARYLIWDGHKYRSIRRSGPLHKVCG